MRRLLLALAVVLALTGCVAIPDSGPVLEGDVAADVESSDLVYIAEAPIDGATQEEIVLGFLAAGMSPRDDFAIARQYLAAAEAARWNPAAGVLVRDMQPEVTLVGDTAATAVVSLLSTLDPDGALSLADGDRMLEFRLLQEGGQWRIAAAPDGIVLSSFHFGQLFRPHAVHWLTPDGARAVPEERWFERTATTLAGRIVDAQLGAPSSWLASAVTTAAPDGARRLGEPIVEGATASVRLSALPPGEVGVQGLHPLAAQLAMSLGATGIRTVEVTVDGLDGVAASSADAPPIDEGDVDPRALVLEGSALRLLGSGSGATAIDDVGPQLAALGASAYTVGDAGGVAHAGRRASWIAGAEVVEISADAPVPPTVDDAGWVLLAEAASPQQLTAWRAGERIPLPLPTGFGRIAAMELARDGTRLVVATEDGARSGLRVLALERDGAGTPVALGAPHALPEIEGAVTDVTWVSPTQVAVLSTVADSPEIAVVTIGAGSEQLPQPGDRILAIVGGSEGTSTLRALDADGAVLSLRGRVWSSTASPTSVALIATQQ